MCGILVAVASILPLPETAHAAAYTFTNIADTNGIYAHTGQLFGGSVGLSDLAINNAGMVAFSSRLDDGTSGIFRSEGSFITSIALTSGPVFSGLNGASINSAGTVAFEGFLDANGENGIFTGSGGPITTVALNTEPTFSAFGSPVINGAGTVAFRANLDSGDSGIFARNGAVTTTIAIVSGPIFSGVGGELSINSGGMVAFVASLDSGGNGLFTSSGGSPTTITLGNLSVFGSGSINDEGKVVFISSTGEIFTGDGGPLTLIADISGDFSGFGFHPTINNLGMVAFAAGLDNGVSGIYTGEDPVSDKVIETGDMLFGQHVRAITLAPPNEVYGNIDINDLGQIAFHYELFNGDQGIAVATPVIPEPGLAFLLLIGVTFLGSLRHGRVSDSTKRPT